MILQLNMKMPYSKGPNMQINFKNTLSHQKNIMSSMLGLSPQRGKQ